jgi:hypothetical protein
MPATVRSLGVCPWKRYWDPGPSSLSLLPTCIRGVTLSPCAPPWRTVLLQTQNNRIKWPWTDTSEIMNQNKPFFLLHWSSQIFRHSNRNLPNTVLLGSLLFILEFLTRFNLVQKDSWIQRWCLEHRLFRHNGLQSQLQNLLPAASPVCLSFPLWKMGIITELLWELCQHLVTYTH